MAVSDGMATSVALGSSISQSKPRLTYSSVIHLLVEQITKRSPFLRSSDDDGDQDIALLCRDEIRTGQLLGTGNFSNVFEVASLDLREQQRDGRILDVADADKKENKDPPCDGSIERLPRSEVASTEHRDETAEDQWIHLRSNLRANREHLCLKCLKPELLEGDNPKVFLDAATDLVVEAKYLSKLSHKNILKVRGLAEGWESAFSNGEYDSFFILIDRLDETLNQRIKRWRHGELPEENSMERKLPLMRQLASALAYLHARRILFRDCKPQNIGLSMEQESSLSIKLFDFGFCRELPALVQARDDVEDRVSSSVASLKSGEQVFLMSGKGTRRYMAPEALQNRYNLKADVYSWSMVTYETLTLQKPYKKYTKEQHKFFVCERGDRPPLDQLAHSMIRPMPSFNSPSASFSSMHSSNSCSDASIDVQHGMTEHIRHLLRHAWHHDVSERLSMIEVLKALDKIILDQGNRELNHKTPIARAHSNISTAKLPGKGCSCLSAFADYGDMRNLVAAFAHDLPKIPFLTCFGHDQTTQQENIPLQRNDPVTIEQSETNKVCFAKPKQQLREQNWNGNFFQHHGSQLRTLLQQ